MPYFAFINCRWCRTIKNDIFILSIIFLVGILFLNTRLTLNTGVTIHQSSSREERSDLHEELSRPGNRRPKRINSDNLNDHQWIKKLKDEPHQHDKIEFNVAITCFTFDIESKIKKVLPLLNKKEKSFFVKQWDKILVFRAL